MLHFLGTNVVNEGFEHIDAGLDPLSAQLSFGILESCSQTSVNAPIVDQAIIGKLICHLDEVIDSAD